MMGENQTGECWFGDGKLYLTIPGKPEALELDLNEGGSLQAAFGELKRRAADESAVKGSGPSADY